VSTREFVVAVITAILSTGGASFVRNLVKGWSTVRSGARVREREAFDDIASARDDAEDRCRAAERRAGHWQRMAYGYLGQLLAARIEPNPTDPTPPWESPR
jgi:hypothetical protein